MYAAAGIALEEEQFPLLPSVVAHNTAVMNRNNTHPPASVSGTSSARGRSRNNSITEYEPPQVSSSIAVVSNVEGEHAAVSALGSPARSYAPAPATATAAAGLQSKAARPPLGKLNMSNLSTLSPPNSTEPGRPFFDSSSSAIQDRNTVRNIRFSVCCRCRSLLKHPFCNLSRLLHHFLLYPEPNTI